MAATQQTGARKLRVMFRFPSDGAEVLGVVVVQGGTHTGYTVRCEPHDYGADLTWEREDTGDVYRVAAAAAGTVRSCSCPGWRFHGHCRHAAGTAALAERGLVPLAATN